MVLLIAQVMGGDNQLIKARVSQMSDKFNKITVVLEHNVCDEQIDTITSAISMVRGVLSVEAHQVDHGSDYLAEVRVRSELRRKLFEVLQSDH